MRKTLVIAIVGVAATAAFAAGMLGIQNPVAVATATRSVALLPVALPVALHRTVKLTPRKVAQRYEQCLVRLIRSRGLRYAINHAGSTHCERAARKGVA